MPMQMHGGGSMTMPWGPMPGQTWLGATASFLGMWIVMMAAMMLPSLAPMLGSHWRAARRAGVRRAARLTAIAGGGYLLTWAMFGLAAFPLGAALAAVARAPSLTRTAPLAAGVVVLIAGAFQVSAWKAHHLACYRNSPANHRAQAANAGTSLRHGVRLGLHCCASCLNLTAILLVLGAMDLRVTAAVTAAITVERLAPAGERVARGIGAAIIVGSLVMIARASGLT